MVSLAEDGAVGVVTFLAIQNPELAALIAAVLLSAGICLIVLPWKKLIHPAWIGLRNRRPRPYG